MGRRYRLTCFILLPARVGERQPLATASHLDCPPALECTRCHRSGQPPVVSLSARASEVGIVDVPRNIRLFHALANIAYVIWVLHLREQNNVTVRWIILCAA